MEERPIRFGVVGASSGMVSFHLNVLIQDNQQREVVCAKLWNEKS